MYRVNDVVILHRQVYDRLKISPTSYLQIVMIDLRGYHISVDGNVDELVLVEHRDIAK